MATYQGLNEKPAEKRARVVEVARMIIWNDSEEFGISPLLFVALPACSLFCLLERLSDAMNRC